MWSWLADLQTWSWALPIHLKRQGNSRTLLRVLHPELFNNTHWHVEQASARCSSQVAQIGNVLPRTCCSHTSQSLESNPASRTKAETDKKRNWLKSHRLRHPLFLCARRAPLIVYSLPACLLPVRGVSFRSPLSHLDMSLNKKLIASLALIGLPGNNYLSSCAVTPGKTLSL